MYEFLSKLIDRQTILFFLLGIALILLSAFHGLAFIHLPINSNTWLWLLGILGFLFIVLGGVSFSGILSRRPSAIHLIKKYNIKITSHTRNDRAISPIELRGTFKNAPEKGHVFAIERNDSRHQYYIKDEIVFYNDNNWRTQIHIGNGDNLPRTLIVGYFGEDSKTLLEYYNKVRQEQAHVGIKAFPSDFHPLAEVTIVLQKP